MPIQVRLLDHSSDPVRSLYLAYRTCYSALTPIELAERVEDERISREQMVQFVEERLQTGHGSPLPPLVHGGPGRAGGGEELGGIRGVFHYMQRTAVQGSPRRLATVAHTWNRGADERPAPVHPFRRTFDDLEVGETIHTPARKVTVEDIEHFAHFTGDSIAQLR